MNPEALLALQSRLMLAVLQTEAALAQANAKIEELEKRLNQAENKPESKNGSDDLDISVVESKAL